MKSTKLYLRYIASTAEGLVRKNSREKKYETSVVDIIKEHTKQWMLGLDDKSTKIDIDEVTKILVEDEMYLADFEVVDGMLKRIQYEPFTCEFKTSGKIVVENDLREFFEEDDFDINATKGIIQTMQYYADQKMLHGFVGNSCPGVYGNDKGNIIIGCESDEDYEPIIPEGFKELTYVCTDLWWYSIIDLEVLKELDKNFDEKNYTVVEIPAGTYKLTHKYGVSEKGYHENLPYAHLDLIK